MCALPGTTIDAATALMATVNAYLNEGPEHGSVTVGIASLEPDDSLGTLLHRADTALYLQRAKGTHSRKPTDSA